MPTIDELRLLQAQPLELKIMRTQARIREWVDRFGVDGVYISFSGGKDSTVLLDIARKLYPNIRAVFANTGLEYPEIQSFVKQHENVDIIRPKMRFDEVIKTYGYPFISKDVAMTVYYARKNNAKWAWARLNGENGRTGEPSEFRKERYAKYKPLTQVDFNISSRCCYIMKEKPLDDFKKSVGFITSMTAIMADESERRKEAWLKTGCNSFDSKSPMSKPMSFWTEQDVLKYIKDNSIEIASVYGDVVEVSNNDKNQLCIGDCGKLSCTKCQRTGCIFCGYGAHHDKDGGGESRFVRLKHTHPKQYDYCMGGGEYNDDGIWQPNKDGLGMAHCIDVLNSIYSKKGKPFIEY